MKITEVETIPIRVPIRKNILRSRRAGGAFNRIITKIKTEEGIEGLGEAAPTTGCYWEETFETSLEVIQKYMGPSVIGDDPFNIEKINEKLDRLPLNTAAKAAIDIALFDIIGKSLNVPIYKLLGGCYREKILAGWELTIGKPEEMTKEAEYALELGFRQLKIKLGTPRVGREPSFGNTLKEDVSRFKAIKNVAGDDIILACDVNGRWRTNEATRLIKTIDRFEPAFIEQPLPRWDIDGLAEMSKFVEAPIMADESVRTIEDAVRLVRKRAVRSFNIKIMKHGGLYNCKKIAAIAEGAGISCIVGSMIELGIASAAMAHFAASTKVLEFGNEGIIEGPLSVERDILAEGLKFEKGYLEVPRGPGLGITLDEEIVRVYAENFKHYAAK